MAPDPTDAELQSQFRQNLGKPAKAANETGSAEQHLLRDQIAAQKFVDGKASARRGITMRRIVNPGPRGGC